MERIILPFAAACLAAVLTTSPAHASRSFPRDLHNDLKLHDTPPCSVCHESGKTGIGTVTTPFGESMRARGLRAGDDSSLAQALASEQRDNADSDGDGVSDVDELINGTDPNRYGFDSSFAQEPSYGCAVGGSGGGSLAAIGLFAGLAIALLRAQKRGAKPRL